MYPWYCPKYRTPVPGGFSFEQAAYLFGQSLAKTNKEIIGFDLVEVAPGDDDWDGECWSKNLFPHVWCFLRNLKKMNIWRQNQV